MSDIEKREGVRSPLRDLSNSPVNSGGLGGLAGLTKSAPAAPTFGLGSLLDNKDVYSSQASSGLGLGLGGLGAAKPSSNNQDLADNLLQSKIGHLEKERAAASAMGMSTAAPCERLCKIMVKMTPILTNTIAIRHSPTLYFGSKRARRTCIRIHWTRR